jgi:hypothetical protein
VTNGGDTQRYIVTINPYAETRSWNGTVTLGSNTENKTTVSVLARGADIKEGYTAEVTPGATGNWTLDAPLTFIPVSFIVTLTNADEEIYRSKAYSSPDVTINVGQSIPLIVNCAAVSTGEVGKAVFSPNDLAGFSSAPAQNYSLADDITLPSDWTGGPTGYTGKFYGNGYSISNLTFTEVKGKLGLFNSLGNYAEIHDLTVNVPYTTDPIPMTAASGDTFFGAVVGSTGSQNILIRGVTVKGGLNLGPQSSPTHFSIGCFFGEVSPGGNVKFENCVSDMVITIDTNQHSTANGNGTVLSGFVGTTWLSNASFTNCYSAGKIEAKLSQSQRADLAGLVVGGFVGAGASGGITITNCYSAIGIDSQIYEVSSAAVKGNTIGGFIGYPTNQPITILNTLALNPYVRGVNGTINAGRVIGKDGTGAQSYNGLYALESMELTANGQAVSVASNVNGKDGESKSLTELRDKDFWIGLGFSEANWDFAPLTATTPGWPVLK